MRHEDTAMQRPEPFRTASAWGPRRTARAAGVSLIELLAVVVIIAILGLIAIPSYRQYAIRAHRTEGKAALLRLATNQERFYIQNHRYSDTVDGSLGFLMPKSENGVYAITVTTMNGWTQDYTATATPVAGGGADGVDQTVDTDCTSFSLTSAGAKSATGNQPASCW
jgi:type IV pilus assembly protein PilE